MGAFIFTQRMKNKRDSTILEFTTDIVQNYKNTYNDASSFTDLYLLYLKLHPFSIYRFLGIDAFIKHKNLSFNLTEIIHPEMVDRDAFANKLKEYGTEYNCWVSYSDILEGKPFDERKRICESLTAYSTYEFDKYGNLKEILQFQGDFYWLSGRTNITEDYKRKYKAGEKVRYGDSVVTIVDVGPDDSIPYSCLGWSEHYWVEYKDGCVSDWIREEWLEPLDKE